MSPDWWVPFVQWTLVGLAMTAVMGWVGKSRLGERPDSERETLRHPASTLAIAIVGVVFFFGTTIILNMIVKNPGTIVWITLLLVAFGLGSVLMISEYFFVRHRVSDRGIEYGRMLGQRGSLQWSEVQSIRYAPVMKWFEIEAASGTKIRVSAFLIGLPEFARFVLLHVPGDVIESDTHMVLQQTEWGRPPNVWR